MDKLLLFDIDGTLTTGMTHTETFDHGFKIVYGKDIVKPSGQHAGMTDPQIIKRLLLKEGISEDIVDRHMEQMQKEMVKRYKEIVPGHNVILIEGASEMLRTLKAKGVLLGLVTGNLEEIAHLKLGKVGIDKFFSVGGFGSDHWKRSELIAIAIQKAKKEFGFKGEVFYIGDSPLDVEAGIEAGVKTIGFAYKQNKQKYTEEDLKRAGADLAISSYDERLIEFILGK